MSSIVKRIKHFLDVKGVTMAEMERTCGISNGTFQKAFTKNASIKSETIEKILSVYDDISAEYILRGDGDILKVENNASILAYLQNLIFDKDKEIKNLNIELGSIYERLKKYENKRDKRAI